MTISLTPDSSSLNVMSNKINLKITKLYKENRFFGAFSFSFNVGLWCKCDIKTDEVANIWTAPFQIDYKFCSSLHLTRFSVTTLRKADYRQIRADSPFTKNTIANSCFRIVFPCSLEVHFDHDCITNYCYILRRGLQISQSYNFYVLFSRASSTLTVGWL